MRKLGGNIEVGMGKDRGQKAEERKLDGEKFGRWEVERVRR